MATYALTKKAIVLKPEDDVAVATAGLTAGTVLEDGAARITVLDDITVSPATRSPAGRAGPVSRCSATVR